MAKKRKRDKHSDFEVVPVKRAQGESEEEEEVDAEERRPEDEVEGEKNEQGGEREDQERVTDMPGKESVSGGEDASARGADAAAEAAAAGRTVYIGGIPYYASEDDIVEYFEGYTGAIESVDMLRFADSGKFRGIAMVTFVARESAEQCLKYDGEGWDDKYLTIKRYAPPAGAAGRNHSLCQNQGEEGVKRREEKKLVLADASLNPGYPVAFVCNLSYDATAADVRDVFAGFGEVEAVRMGVHKETGEPRGFAHVVFKEEAAVTLAVKQTQKVEIHGRKVAIGYAQQHTRPSTKGKHQKGKQKQGIMSYTPVARYAPPPRSKTVRRG